MIQTRDELKNRALELGMEQARGPRSRILVSMGTCGVAAGTTPVLEAVRREVENRDLAKAYEVVETGCMGLCHSEPSIEVVDTVSGNSAFYVNVKPEQAAAIVEAGAYEAAGVEELPRNWHYPEMEENFNDSIQTRIVLRNSGRINPESLDAYLINSGYQGLAKALDEFSPEDVIQLVKDSGLRGRGGGGFPAGVKWGFAAAQDSDEKFIICNADEGDPGAFMDRAVLEGDPHAVLEAMAIAGYAIGAHVGIIYIRAEYPLAVKRLQIGIDKAKAEGLLGDDILGSGFSFDIQIKYGAGAFVCGEETALIHSIEGKRGEPTFKPPYPAVSGLYGKPTIVNNVETFANLPAIFRNGVDWFRKVGTAECPGTKVFALAGKVNRVGLVEVPMGTTLRDLIFTVGGGITDGKAFKAVQTGGPSGGCITDKNLDHPITYESLRKLGSMMGSGGIIVMDEDDCMVNVAKFFLEFTLDESCGKCTPCRIGNKRLHEMLEELCSGKGTEQTLQKLSNLSRTIKDTALCGLGQTSPNPVLSTMKQFEDEYREHVYDRKCRAGVCRKLITFVINDKCVGCTLCARTCPVNCISGERKQKHEIDQSQCIKCGQCYDVCKFHAIDRV